MKSIGLVVHPDRPQAIEAADRVRMIADSKGLVVVDLQTGEDAESIVALGGDGTMLRAAKVAAQRGIPLLGINFGQLGYLSTVEASDLETAMEALSTDTYSISLRMLIEAELEQAGTLLALNEFVVEREIPSRVVDIKLMVGPEEVATYTADGFIVATPTGSTAYSLSAGGPIVEPNLEALVLTPVSAHSPLWRSMVVGTNREITLEVVQGTAVLSADGQVVGQMPKSSHVRVRKHPEPLRLVNLHDYNFFRRVSSRFHT